MSTVLWWLLPYIGVNRPEAHPEPTLLPTPSLWVVPEPRLWMPCFMRSTCTGCLLHMVMYISVLFPEVILPLPSEVQGQISSAHKEGEETAYQFDSFSSSLPVHPFLSLKSPKSSPVGSWALCPAKLQIWPSHGSRLRGACSQCLLKDAVTMESWLSYKYEMNMCQQFKSLINERMSKMLKLVQKSLLCKDLYFLLTKNSFTLLSREELFALSVFTIYVVSLKHGKIA